MDRPTVLLVEPASSGLSLLGEAGRLGWRVAVATHDEGDRRMPARFRRGIDDLIKVDTNDLPAVERAARDLARAHRLIGVVPGFEFYVPAAAHVARRLGLPALTQRTALACRDKSVMRREVEAAGLRVPRYADATDEASLASAARHVGFPCVLKPSDSAGSVHVSRCDTWSALVSAYRRLCADPRLDFGRTLQGNVLVEEYIGGREVSVEGLADGGAVRVLAVTSKLLGPEPFFVEMGHIVHADLSRAVRAEVERYAAAVVGALGISLGPFHCEIRIDDRGPVLIEIGARLAGDHIVDLVELTTGVSLPRQMLRAYTGLQPEPADGTRRPQARCAGVRFFTAGDLARYRSIEEVRDRRSQPWVLDVEVSAGAGDEAPPEGDFRSRLGHALFVADDYTQAERRWRDLGEGVRRAA